MQFIQGDFFKLELDNDFDAVITDPPYKGVTTDNCPVEGRLGELDFCMELFLTRADEITKKDAALIVFGNFINCAEFHHLSKKTSWKFIAEQVWDKRPTRNWISWSRPLRHCEYYIYLAKGKFRYSFKTGKVKPKVNRNSFGGPLRSAVSANPTKVSYEMYEQIVTYKVDHKNKVHPTEKPIDFSEMFRKNLNMDNPKVIDPFCGSGNLLHAFPDAVGVDLRDWRDGV